MKSIQIFLLLFIALSSTNWAAETPAANAVQVPSAGTTTTPSSQWGALPFPLIRISDTYGFIGGVGIGIYDAITQSRLSATIQSNFGGFYRFSTYQTWIKPNEWRIDANAFTGNDTEDFFGEGDNTPTHYTAYVSSLNEATLVFSKAITPTFYFGPSVQYVYRNWQSAVPANDPDFDDESEFRLGLQAMYDSRDNIRDAHHGFYWRIGGYGIPTAGNQGFSADVIQVESDTRVFIQFENHWVLALRVNAAYTWGIPSYTFNYSLGGVDQLRGYHTTRFFGKDFYDTQSELRIPVIRYFTLNFSVDAGDITDDQFGAGPLWSFQTGVRSTILAFSGALLRFEMGVGKDQTNFIFSASEPF